VHTMPDSVSTSPTEDGSAAVPRQYLCPISHQIMADPVVAADGHSYERTAIEEWRLRAHTSPMTAVPMREGVTTNHNLKSQILEFKESIVRGIHELASLAGVRDLRVLIHKLARAQEIARSMPDATGKPLLWKLLVTRAGLPPEVRGADVFPDILENLPDKRPMFESEKERCARRGLICYLQERLVADRSPRLVSWLRRLVHEEDGVGPPRSHFFPPILPLVEVVVGGRPLPKRCMALDGEGAVKTVVVQPEAGVPVEYQIHIRNLDSKELGLRIMVDGQLVECLFLSSHGGTTCSGQALDGAGMRPFLFGRRNPVEVDGGAVRPPEENRKREGKITAIAFDYHKSQRASPPPSKAPASTTSSSARAPAVVAPDSGKKTFHGYTLFGACRPDLHSSVSGTWGAKRGTVEIHYDTIASLLRRGAQRTALGLAPATEETEPQDTSSYDTDTRCAQRRSLSQRKREMDSWVCDLTGEVAEEPAWTKRRRTARPPPDVVVQ
jgi:hypothetical protein